MQEKLGRTAPYRLAVLGAALAVLAACGQEPPPAESPVPEDTSAVNSHSAQPQRNVILRTAEPAPKTRQDSGSPLDPRLVRDVYAALDGPDAGSGVVRYAAAEPETPVQNAVIATEIPDIRLAANSQPGGSSDLSTGNSAAVDAAAPHPTGLAALATGQSAEQPPRTVNIVSDEQDFEAVAQRESIESDALRLRKQRDGRVVFLPEDLPEKPGVTSVAQFALNTTNSVGNKLYGRFGSFITQHSLSKRCAEFGGDYAAQQAFLDAGGPKTDKLLLDPDGDGFACGWTPEIYRSMIN